MLTRFFALLHAGYSRLVGVLGRHLPAFIDPREAPVRPFAPASGDFALLDAQANRLGNLYRGLGVFTALIGLGVAVCEELAGKAAWLPMLRLAALLGVGSLVFLAWRTGLRARWLETRKAAEAARYEFLVPADADRSSWTEQDDLRLQRAAELCRDQIAYNDGRYRHFTAMRRVGSAASWLAIACTLLWTIAQVVATPAPVASGFRLLATAAFTVMGINGFLGVGGLRNAHREMRDALTSHVLPRLQPNADATAQSHHEAMADLHVALSSRDSAWLKFASQLDLPAT